MLNFRINAERGRLELQCHNIYSITLEIIVMIITVLIIISTSSSITFISSSRTPQPLYNTIIGSQIQKPC